MPGSLAVCCCNSNALCAGYGPILLCLLSLSEY